MLRRHGRQMGCFEFVLVVIALFVALQFVVLGLKVLQELFILMGTLVKWAIIAIAGAVGIAALMAVLAGLGYGLKQAVRGLLRSVADLQNIDVLRRTLRTNRVPSYYKQACIWRNGIIKTVRELQKRRWLTKEDAHRYRKSTEAAMKRLRSMEQDLRTLNSLPAAEEWIRKVSGAAQRLRSRLERTHHALTRLLAESALQAAPIVDRNIREAAEELESLIAALDEINGSHAVAQADPSVKAQTPKYVAEHYIEEQT